MIKAVVFDLDDTLISEKEYILSGFNEVSQHLSKSYNLDREKVYSQLVQLFKENSQNVFNRVLDLHEINYTLDMITELIQVYRQHVPTISLYDDAKVILTELDKSNLKLGIITDGYQLTQRNKLVSLDIERYFDSIIVTDELGREFWKPHAKPYELMKKHLDVQFNEMIYVGDNLSKDFITANKLGMTTIHIKREDGVYSSLQFGQEYHAHHQITSLEQLKGYL